MKQARYYRANKNNNGVASAWQLAYKPEKKFDQYEMFLTVAPQTGYDESGNGSFDWKEKAIIVKLGDNDLAELIAVLDGRKDSLGFKGSLYHETPGGGNKAVKLDFVEGAYKFSVSAQDAEKNKIGPYYQTLGQADAVMLSILLKKAIEKFYLW